MANKQRALWSVAGLALALLGVHTARSEPAGLKTFKEGDVLTAADLNANFVAANASTPPLVWSAFAPAHPYMGLVEGAGNGQGRVATFNFSAAAAGEVLVTASYEVRVRNTFDAASRVQCGVESRLSDSEPGFQGCGLGEACNVLGYARSSINANLPTQDGSGTYLGLSQTVSRVLPLKQGLNTFYLFGRTDCPSALWGAITFNALSVQSGGTATASVP